MTASTAVHSNAFNFLSFLQSGVDSRTGLYTVSCSLPEVKTCDLSGPVVPLALGYNPLNTTDSGYGQGWNLALTQYTPSTQIMSVHSGETFRVTGPHSGAPNRLRMKEQKIESFQLYELSNDPLGDYKVVHKSGLVEILKLTGSNPQVAMPVRIYSPQGHEVTLTYGNAGDGRMLSTLRDSQGILLEIIKDTTAHAVNIRVKPVNGVPSALFVLGLEGDLLTRITLPTTNNAGWRFLYGTERGLLCIKEVWTPLGAHERVQYNDEGHGFPSNSGHQNLPRVTHHFTDPGGGEPAIEVEYGYSDNGNNFLGFNAPISWDDDGYDNLYKVNVPYLYGSTERLMVAGSAVRTVSRTFNRFHLLTSEATIQGNCRKTARTTYYADDSLLFEQQVRQCQLPQQVSTLWGLTDDPRQWRHDKEISEYDIHGNQTLRVQANGITETTRYFPAEEVPGECPADPYGFVRHVREKTVTPASDSALVPDLQGGAPTLRTRYRYEEQPAIDSISGSWLALAQEHLLELDQQTERLLVHTVYHYFNTPTNHLLHGRRKRQAVTLGEVPGYTTFTDFEYSKPNATYATFTGESVLLTKQILSTDFDSVTKEINEERSLLTGEPLLITDKNTDEQLRYTYDALGRVLSETEAPDTEYPATRTFSYRLIRPAGPDDFPVTERANQIMVDVKGVSTRTRFDGLARAIREELQDVDNAGGNPASYRDIYTARYDALGQLTSETVIDWLHTTNLRLTSTYTYDHWGQQDSVTGPDGIKSYTHNNPITFLSEAWTEGMGKTVTLVNRFDKPIKTERFDLSGQRISLHRLKYDGLGNCAEEVDALGRITRYRYDTNGRLVSSTLPDKTVISRTYAAHSSAQLPTALVVKSGNAQQPSRTVGEQVFDGLERLTQVTVGPRVERLHYEAGRLQPQRRLTPSGKPIDYEYKPGLTTQPIVIKAPDDNATFNYDVLNGNLEQSSNDQGAYSFTYSGAGHLSVETWSEPANPVPWVTRYTSSLKGRQLTRTDVGGQITSAEHDHDPVTETGNGRLLKVTQCQLQAEFEYDACGRLYRTTSTDLKTLNKLTTTLTFDDIGRETLRTLTLNDVRGQALQDERRIELTYLADGNVSTRHLRVGSTTALLEIFGYDLRGRLELYECSGDDLPNDRFGNAIVKQFFEFDTLDNIIYSRTTFADGTRDIAEFGFATDDPCQLVSATHSHADYQELKTDFNYDPDGNLTHDELGQQLHYDSQGRLMGVDAADGQPGSAYRYDSHDHLLAVKPEGEFETLRFYQGDRLSDTIQDGQHTQLLYHRDQPLGQQTPGDDSQTLLLLSDAKSSIIGESQDADLRSAVYSPYGERSSDDDLQSLLAFNGEVRDPVSGWYLLGRGYRAYNPGLMRFHSPDSMSPFGPGGINCYMYCSGNPIAFSDPTGHARQGQMINNPWFGGGVTIGTLVLGIAVSLMTLNPGPLAAAFASTVASAVTSTATALGASAGTTAMLGAVANATAVGITTAAVNAGATLVSLGVEGGAMFVRDQNASEVLSYAGLAIGLIAIPGIKGFKPSLANPLLHIRSAATESSISVLGTSSVRSASSASSTASAVPAPRLVRSNSAPNLSNRSPFDVLDSLTLEQLTTVDSNIQNFSLGAHQARFSAIPEFAASGMLKSFNNLPKLRGNRLQGLLAKDADTANVIEGNAPDKVHWNHFRQKPHKGTPLGY
jgi:RHS repeat-associated protein